MNKFKHILISQSNKLDNIFIKAKQISIVNALVKEYLDPIIAKHLKVANIRDNQVIIEFDSSAWASKGRFLLPDILGIVRSKYQDIKTIDHYVK